MLCLWDVYICNMNVFVINYIVVEWVLDLMVVGKIF